MSDTDKVFAGSIPDIYDEFLVPLIFESYAEDMARRVASAGPSVVLETAAGSGVVTRALAPKLDAGAHYVVTDLNQPMLDRAARRQPADSRIAWQQADALSLPFGDESFDAVCCQFGVMFFPDRAAGYREAYRVLRGGGRFVFNSWDRIEENVFADSVTESAGRHFAEDPPRFLARTPHGYHDIAEIEADLRAAGFDRIEIETVSAESRASSPRHPAVAYCQGTPLRNEIEARDASALEAVTDSAARDLAARFGTGAITGKIQGHVVIATR
ncbi:methyltransferase domain-containing protein [Rhodobacterales bacterium HKCCE3408]|nr:methyltransferase domain-containing protein [Rhodobacterales bacterium HKCCE3408]